MQLSHLSVSLRLGVLFLAQSTTTLAAPVQEGPPAGGRLAAPGLDLGDKVMAQDGQPAARGRVPEGTSQGASDLWRKLITSLAPPKVRAEANAARSFELEFNGRIRSETGSNEYKARFAYLEQGPGLVRAIMLNKRGEAKSIQTRGLGAGDRSEYWFKKLIGDTKSDWIELTRADYREDRDETDRWASISYDIARLTDPASFRIVSLQLRSIKDGSTRIGQGILDFQNDPGVRLPDTNIHGVVGGRGMTVAQLAKGLVWLELATPDFKDLSSSKKTRRQLRQEQEAGIGPKVQRLVFGIDPKTSRPQLVIVAPHRSDMPLQVGGSLLVQCTDWILSGPEGKPKSYVPGSFLSYETAAATKEEEQATGLRRRFSNSPSADLYISELSDMAARLRREDFLPH